MKQRSNLPLSLAGVITLAASMFAGCTEYVDDPAEFTSENIVINYTDSVIDASISSGSRTRSVSESTEIGSSVLTSKTGKKMYLSCMEAPWPVEKTALTRGTKVTTAGISNLGVSASVYPAANTYTSAGCGSYFYKESVSSGTPMTYYWPASNYKISFFGYYPYNNASFTVQSAADATGVPTYAYTVPSTIASQQDIMTGQVTDQPGGSSSPVNMTLAHRCVAIRFCITNDRSEAITVNSISIEGVKYTGTLNEDTWTLGDDVNSSSSNPFTLTCNTSVAAETTADITGTSNIFMMLPQALPSGAKLKVVVDDEDFEAEITGTWTAGKEYSYGITMSESDWDYILNVSGPSAYSYTGGTNSYSITSYKQNSAGTKTKAAAWTISYDTNSDGVFSDSKPSWLTLTSSGDGGASASSYNATVTAQSAITPSSGTGTALLRAATPVSNYDLSDPNGVGSPQNTANCYMVHAPGTYKLPLVYGNAIKNGSTNSGAYNPSGSSSATFLKPFINHAGSGITDPYLKNNNATPNGVSLVWQDVKSLIKNGSLAIDGDYLKFEITSSAIAEGNAVIAATKSGTIVWSWHIWVTPQTYSNLTNISGYNVTPVNLGWAGSGTITKSGYEGRRCSVKVTQTESGQTRTFAITQSPYITVTFSKTGVNPYYQWGRMTPEIPNRTAYNISGSSVSMVQRVFSSTGTDEAYGNIQNGIKYPLNHYLNMNSSSDGYNGPFQSGQYNLWDAACNTVGNNRRTHAVKTIYDPCPPGFCVPTSGFLYYITTTASTHVWDDTNKGATWNSKLWFPAVGYLVPRGGTAGQVGVDCAQWSGTPSSKGNSYGASMSSWNWSEWGADRAYGFSVRPVAE